MELENGCIGDGIVILDWMDEQETPYLLLSDRMMLVLYDLGITDLEQMSAITGWKKEQIQANIKRIRFKEKDKEKRDEWICSWKYSNRRPNAISLGRRGIEHVLSLRQEFASSDRKRPLTGQIAHFMGINDILKSYIQAEVPVDYWYSSKESASWIYHQLRLGEKPKSQQTLPIRPDAMISVNGIEMFVEFDTGTESMPRVEAKFGRYRDLSLLLGEQMNPILFVCQTEQRAKRVSVAQKDSEVLWRRGKDMSEVKAPRIVCSSCVEPLGGLQAILKYCKR